ncbi:MAG: adenylyl-sulfate kinase [Flavobacteriales bacterium]|jgi:adenylylsulfate kinase|tara:strand:- start:11949 stop:12554 length:606 start_codon:yes stop_codon:yes gene_type:complete
MKSTNKNLFPIFEDIIQRKDKENLLNQNSKVIWLTGMSGSGKTTIAKGLEKYLFSNGIMNQILDGDNIRVGLNKNLSFSEIDRTENIRRIAEVSKLFLNAGIVTINCFVSPLNNMRELAKEIIGKQDFIEIYVNTSLEKCKERDVKGLYKKALNGEIKNFTGIGSNYETPKNPDLEINTTDKSVNESIEELSKFILPKIKK